MKIKEFAEVNGTRLYYEMTGEGEALVLIHSGFTDSRLWDYQFEALGKYFKVVRYDIRGYGRSHKPVESFSHFEDLKTLLEYLRIEKTHLLGVSMGGGIAIDFALEYPESVKSLVLSGSSLNGFTFDIDEASRQRSLAGISIARRDENFNKSVEFMLEDPMWKQGTPEAQERLRDMFMSTSLEWALGDLEIAAFPSAYERLSEINRRTLLIVGSEDSKPIFEIMDALESGIVGAQKSVIDGTGHLPNLDKPEIFNKIVLDFLLHNK